MHCSILPKYISNSDQLKPSDPYSLNPQLRHLNEATCEAFDPLPFLYGARSRLIHVGILPSIYPVQDCLPPADLLNWLVSLLAKELMSKGELWMDITGVDSETWRHVAGNKFWDKYWGLSSQIHPRATWGAITPMKSCRRRRYGGSRLSGSELLAALLFKHSFFLVSQDMYISPRVFVQWRGTYLGR